ncbi:MAG: poly-gamma-glutamate system protein [Deltaproteobacteria bacterium]|nr:poly-gamma-glutamate system protein [Deltaproteobacteria bacterium]
MKKLYWRPSKVSRTVLALVALLSLAGIAAVERLQKRTKQPYLKEKLAAARLAQQALAVLKTERLHRQLPVDRELDPAETGLIGLAMSPITSNSGLLASKQTSANPNWAAVIVQMLKKAGVREGEAIAVGASGSFPALNVAVYAAAQALKLKPVVVTSVSASQFGANIPGFTWLDMEQVLFDRHVFSFRSVGASLGGVEDRGLGLSREGRAALEEAIQRHGTTQIRPANYQQSVEERMRLYTEHAGGTPIRAYINIGGGTASVGTTLGKKLFRPGLNRTPPTGAAGLDAVMTRFITDGIPVIHMVQIARLAKRYGLPDQPATIPTVGTGEIFYRQEYNEWLAGAVLAALLVVLYAFIRSDWGVRLLMATRRGKESAQPPQRMV